MTNYEKIKTIEDKDTMLELLAVNFMTCCHCASSCTECYECVKKWLDEEADDD